MHPNFSSLLPRAFYCVLLLLFCFISSVDSVCHHCFGAGGKACSGDGKSCPWATQVNANAAAVSAGLGAAVVVTTLLPAKLLRLFPRFCLDAISALASKIATQGAPFDFQSSTPPSTKEIINAVKMGSATRQDAILFFKRMHSVYIRY